MAQFQYCARYSQRFEPLAYAVDTAWDISPTPSVFETRLQSSILEFASSNKNNVVNNRSRRAKHPKAKMGLGYPFPTHAGTLP